MTTRILSAFSLKPLVIEYSRFSACCPYSLPQCMHTGSIYYCCLVVYASKRWWVCTKLRCWSLGGWMPTARWTVFAGGSTVWSETSFEDRKKEKKKRRKKGSWKNVAGRIRYEAYRLHRFPVLIFSLRSDLFAQHKPFRALSNGPGPGDCAPTSESAVPVTESFPLSLTVCISAA